MKAEFYRSLFYDKYKEKELNEFKNENSELWKNILQLNANMDSL